MADEPELVYASSILQIIRIHLNITLITSWVFQPEVSYKVLAQKLCMHFLAT